MTTTGRRLAAAYAAITAAFFLAVAGCSSKGSPEPLASESEIEAATADLRSVTARWDRLSAAEHNEVCETVRQAGEPDYEAMADALIATGLSENEAAEMLPYTAARC